MPFPLSLLHKKMGLFSKAVGKAKEAKGFVKATSKMGGFRGPGGDLAGVAAFQVTKTIETGKDHFDEQMATSLAMQTANPPMRNSIVKALDEYFNYSGKDVQKIANFLEFLYYLVGAGVMEMVDEIHKKMTLLEKYKGHSNDKIAEDMEMLEMFFDDEEFQKSTRAELKLQGNGLITGGGHTTVVGDVNYVNNG